jgi:outer membrane translocation and assembly module TamA
VATRAVFDVLMGHVPFYELSRFEETSALGGLKGVRGVPAQRYYGKVKLFGNLELRARVTEFSLLNKRYVLGMVAFLDGGRLWSDFTPERALDGSGLGLKYGTGAGIRLQEGKTFVIRADLAWSPDARPVGGYLAAGQIF